MLNLVKLRVGEVVQREQLIEDLSDRLGYRRQDFVARPGDYAERGGVVDIYPLTYVSPVRVTFRLDEIESIHDFLIETGESLTAFAEITLIPLNSTFERKLEHFEEKLRERRPIRARQSGLKTFLDIREGDYVVHLDYGIGRFIGFKRLQTKGETRKYYAIEYANGEILYVEAGGPQLFERYIGLEGKSPKLNKLRGGEWKRIKERARLAVKSVARDLLRLQAKRSLLRGYPFKSDTEWQTLFEEEFPYEETPDQIRATLEVKLDMEQDRPMDRLLCGDVGYGKTEVAMRAAFKAVMDGKQVAFLVPTTILAEQHFLTLSDRIKNFPVRVEVLSRFKSRGEQKGVVEGLKRGIIDAVLGTHRLLSPDVEFKNLGLVIVDEEQRFGVRHKERLKELRELVDVLTLTATPIPRTLYLAMLGARDMSVINTPPLGRIPVVTEVIEYKLALFKEIIGREIARGGQVYFVHNRIETIDHVYRELTQVLPTVRFGVAHGRLHAHALEEVMRNFLRKELDCLVSTNIIESGLDIPNVNTILVNRADQFGLADLYQLRGRVGRFFNRQAYAYFIIPKHARMTDEARRRIEAIERFTELGSGFKVAMEDLEIRGAGNILGEQQSGYIYQVGFDLYCRLLQQSVEEQRREVVK